MSKLINRLSTWQRERGASAFAYDATESKGRRREPTGVTASEDAVLPMFKRARVQSSARDLVRNFSIAGWMIRRHLDYVAPHSFHSRSGIESFDREFEAAVGEWSRQGDCESSGRFALCDFVRMVEACASIDGDCGILKLDDGAIQGIESDRIRNPDNSQITNFAEAGWINGVRVVNGRAVSYGIHDRRATGPGYTFNREVPAEALILHGHFTRFDQWRGISPLASGLNSLQDVYEGFGYGIAKLKVEQLFALAFYRSSDESAGELNTSTAVDANGDEMNRGGYEVDFGKGPQVLDLDPGDRAEFLTADSPGGNSREFLLSVIMVALKSLDIPFSFYDESHTNFFGSRAAWLHYERSCKPKRARVRALLDQWTTFRTQVAIRLGLRIPAKLTLSRPWWEWVPEGMPWWNPAQEIKGDADAIANGFTTPQRVCRDRGEGDFYKNVDDIAQAIKYAQAAGVPLAFAMPQGPGITINAAQNDQ